LITHDFSTFFHLLDFVPLFGALIVLATRARGRADYFLFIWFFDNLSVTFSFYFRFPPPPPLFNTTMHPFLRRCFHQPEDLRRFFWMTLPPLYFSLLSLKRVISAFFFPSISSSHESRLRSSEPDHREAFAPFPKLECFFVLFARSLKVPPLSMIPTLHRFFFVPFPGQMKSSQDCAGDADETCSFPIVCLLFYSFDHVASPRVQPE